MADFKVCLLCQYATMHVIKRLTVNCDTPIQYLYFNPTDFWHSCSFSITWPSNEFCLLQGVNWQSHMADFFCLHPFQLIQHSLETILLQCWCSIVYQLLQHSILRVAGGQLSQWTMNMWVLCAQCSLVLNTLESVSATSCTALAWLILTSLPAPAVLFTNH